MVFSSLNFLYVFIPTFLVGYYLIDNKLKNTYILIFSLCFYFFGCFDRPYYIIILIVSLILNYFIALGIDTFKFFRKLFLLISIILNFGTLIVFKYYDFILDAIHILFNHSNLQKLNLILPIGISFYTFQIVSYIIDVYYNKIKAERSFINFSVYVIMFPQLIAGPIVRFVDIMQEIKMERSFNINDLREGLSTFVIGLSSKVIIANLLSLVSVDINSFGVLSSSVFTSWFGAISYALQMYFDFLGYSLMAMGLGRMMGFTIPRNFDKPFFSSSVTEYWRRWHITLSTWFKDYLLYPILLSKPFKNLRDYLSRVSSVRTSNLIVNLIATFVVWIATGLWHGANYNFILWGMYFYVLLNIEQIILLKYLKYNKIFSHFYLIFIITISFVIFKTENLSTLVFELRNMFGFENEITNSNFNYIIINNYKSFLLALLVLIGIPNDIYNILKRHTVLHVISILILLSLSTYLIYIGNNDPFLYFRF